MNEHDRAQMAEDLKALFEEIAILTADDSDGSDVDVDEMTTADEKAEFLATIRARLRGDDTAAPPPDERDD